MSIDFENDRMQSVEQIDSAKKLSDKIIELKDLEDEIANAEESVKKLKEKALHLSAIEIPAMMDEMQITKLKLRDGESVEVKKVYGASIPKDNRKQLLNGFVTTVWVILSKMILPLPLVVAKITRQHHMLTLHEAAGLNLSRKLE